MCTDALSSEITKAYEDLRGIDNTISSLSGRVTRFAERGGRATRGGARGGGIGARLGPIPGLDTRRADERGNGEMHAFPGKRRIFTSTDDPGDYPSKRARVHAPIDDAPDDDDDLPPGGVTRPRRSLQSSVVMPVIETKSRQAAIDEARTSEKQEQSVRNRRLFNNLLVGTLQRFRKDEKKISSVEKVQAEKQAEIEQRLESSKMEEKAKVDRERQELLEQRSRKEREIRLLQRKKAIIHYAEQKQAHYERLRNFIQTQARPPIFYLPGKHTLRTLELLKNSAKRIDDLIATRKEQMERDLAGVGTSMHLPVANDDEMPEGNGGIRMNKTTEERERDSGRPGRTRRESEEESEQEGIEDEELGGAGELGEEEHEGGGDDEQQGDAESPHSSGEPQ